MNDTLDKFQRVHVHPYFAGQKFHAKLGWSETLFPWFLHRIVKFFQLNFLDRATYFKINKFPQLEINKTYT